MPTQAQINFAKTILKSHRLKLRMADQLAERAGIRIIPAQSVQSKLNQKIQATSINDILENYSATALLGDPELRQKLQTISAELNTVKRRF